MNLEGNTEQEGPGSPPPPPLSFGSSDSLEATCFVSLVVGYRSLSAQMFSVMVWERLSNSGAETQGTHLPTATSHSCVFTSFWFSPLSYFSVDSGKEESVSGPLNPVRRQGRCGTELSLPRTFPKCFYGLRGSCQPSTPTRLILKVLMSRSGEISCVDEAPAWAGPAPSSS